MRTNFVSCKIGPARKLPAIYLLDSIAKNVGTPYTLFFGRNLYRTFMDAYSLVEPPVRRKLEEMLQTWKQPVPGSSSSTPVFPSEVTRKIDTALIKARTAAVQAQQQQMKQDQAKFGIKQQNPAINAVNGANQPYRSTPTPPLPRSPFVPPAQTPLNHVLESRENKTSTVSRAIYEYNLGDLLTMCSSLQSISSSFFKHSSRDNLHHPSLLHYLRLQI